MTEHLTAELVRSMLPARPDRSYKGTFGRVVVVAGSLLYPGAASLATAGAARVGAGLVTLAIGRSGILGPGRLAEITILALPEEGWGVIGAPAADEVRAQFATTTALLIGPGLGRDPATSAFVERVLTGDAPRRRTPIGFHPSNHAAATDPDAAAMPPTVVDADALTLLSKIDAWWERVPPLRCVLTPHPGEMQRLLGVAELGSDPVVTAMTAAQRFQQVVVLKDATTVIADPSGRALVHDGANAALATAGTGDVLAGAIAGLIAQGAALFDAAATGVYLQSAAGRLLRADLGDAGTLAGDLLPRLPLAIKQLKTDTN